MTKRDVLIPYEILIRFDEDGPTGAHVQWRRVVELDGEILKNELQEATPLELTGFPTSEIMSATTTAALARLNELQDENQKLRIAMRRENEAEG